MMREQLAKLKMIRTLRSKERRKELQEAQQELARIADHFEERRGEAQATYEAIGQAKAPLHGAGSALTIAEIERAKGLADAYTAHYRQLNQDLARIRADYSRQQGVVGEKQKAVRDAEKAVEQLDHVDDHLAEQEAKEAELQEELQAEAPPKPRWKT
jgi:chromosome segregation ATPase